MEGTLLGVPSIAVSLIGRGARTTSTSRPRLRGAARGAGCSSTALPRGHAAQRERARRFATASEPRGVALTRMGTRRYGDAIVEKVDPRGRKYYWIGGEELAFVDEEGTDFHAVSHGLHLGHADPPRPHQLRVLRRAARAGDVVDDGRERDFERERERMVTRAARGARHPRSRACSTPCAACRATSSCRRRWREHAYDDTPLPIGEQQTISQPYMVALMTRGARLRRRRARARDRHRLRLPGGGARRDGRARRLASSACPTLAARARDVLGALGMADRVRVVDGDGTLGWPGGGAVRRRSSSPPAAPEIPRPLLAQLAPAGVSCCRWASADAADAGAHPARRARDWSRSTSASAAS